MMDIAIGEAILAPGLDETEEQLRQLATSNLVAISGAVLDNLINTNDSKIDTRVAIGNRVVLL